MLELYNAENLLQEYIVNVAVWGVFPEDTLLDAAEDGLCLVEGISKQNSLFSYFSLGKLTSMSLAPR